MGVLPGLTGPDTDSTLSRTLSSLERSQGDRLLAVTRSLELKDAYTSGHHRRVSILARAIAEQMGLSAHETDGIELAAAIHDIGKAFIPASILNKPGALSDFELYVLRGHPRVGHMILKSIETPWPISRIVLEHHERLDGSGYPSGLHGGVLLLQSQVVAVADVMEAMTSRRPYRGALSQVEALDQLSASRGVLYDPEVVDACTWLYAVKGFVLP